MKPGRSCTRPIRGHDLAGGCQNVTAKSTTEPTHLVNWAHHDVPDGEVAAKRAGLVVREESVPEAVGHDVVDLLGALEAHAGDEVVDAALAHEARVEEVVRQVERLLPQLPVRHLHLGRHQAVTKPENRSEVGRKC